MPQLLWAYGQWTSRSKTLLLLSYSPFSLLMLCFSNKSRNPSLSPGILECSHNLLPSNMLMKHRLLKIPRNEAVSQHGFFLVWHPRYFHTFRENSWKWTPLSVQPESRVHVCRNFLFFDLLLSASAFSGFPLSACGSARQLHGIPLWLWPLSLLSIPSDSVTSRMWPRPSFAFFLFLTPRYQEPLEPWWALVGKWQDVRRRSKTLHLRNIWIGMPIQCLSWNEQNSLQRTES